MTWAAVAESPVVLGAQALGWWGGGVEKGKAEMFWNWGLWIKSLLRVIFYLSCLELCPFRR